METFTLDIDYAGVDMVKLKASLDAAGQQALAALQQLKVQSIDLSTMKFKLADGSQVQASTEQLKADVLGTQVWATEKTKNAIVAVEQNAAVQRRGCRTRRSVGAHRLGCRSTQNQTTSNVRISMRKKTACLLG
jgi:hypothetical protein